MTEEQSEQIEEEKKERIKDAVVQCIIKRSTREETEQYIKDKLGEQVMAHDYNRIRGELKRELGTNLKHLQRDKYAYRREYFKRIEEIRLIQRNLWKIIDKNEFKPDLQMSCLSELNQSTVTLVNLYDSIRKLDKEDMLDQNDNGTDERKSEQTEESPIVIAPTPTLPPEVEAPSSPQPSPPEVEAPSSPQPSPPEVEAPSSPQPSPPEVEAPSSPQPSPPEVEAPARRIQKYTADGKPVTT